MCMMFYCFSIQVVGLNFSSATTPELLLKTFDHYCEYRRTPNGVVLSPVQLNKWLVLFCDEINLPNVDKYGMYRDFRITLILWHTISSFKNSAKEAFLKTLLGKGKKLKLHPNAPFLTFLPIQGQIQLFRKYKNCCFKFH